eukprot:gene22107-28207_t
MASIKEEEQNTETELQILRREGDRSMEIDRRQFRAGYEERLQKYLSARQQEYKDSTARSMQSEFARLQLMHDREMAEVDSWLHSEETQIHDRIKTRLQQKVDEERNAAQEELRSAVKSVQDAAEKELELLQRDHVRSVRALQESLEKDLDKHRELLGEKARKLRRSNQLELKGLQESAAARHADLKSGHSRHIEDLQVEHEEAIRRLKKQARDSASLHTETSELSSDLLRLSIDDGGSDGPSSRSSSNKSSPVKRQKGKVSPGVSSSGGGDSQVRRAAEAQRDKQLQNEIRSLETETLRLERSLKAQVTENKARILETQTVEETGNSRRLRNLNEQVADVVLAREKLFRSVQEVQRRSDEVAKTVSEMRREVQVYKDGIAAQRHRAKDREAVHRVRLRELQLQNGPAVRELRDLCEDLGDELRRCERNSDDLLRVSEKQHSEELADMDKQVTADVARIELEVANLREQIETESVRHEKLRALIARYSDNVAQSTEHLRANDRSSSVSSTATRPIPQRAERAPFSTTHSASSGRSVVSTTSSGSSKSTTGPKFNNRK